jgi:hypothetical protein
MAEAATALIVLRRISFATTPTPPSGPQWSHAEFALAGLTDLV